VVVEWIYRPSAEILEQRRFGRAAYFGEDHLRLATALLAAALTVSGAGRADPLLTYPLTIKGHAIRAEVANTPNTRSTGLMFRRSMPENQGMLFVYENEERHAMWMKNTLIPLSVAFIDRGGRIINIEDMQPQTEDTHAAQERAAYSLEMNQGWFKKRGIRKGDLVRGLERVPPSE
jgi:hypothetical protein